MNGPDIEDADAEIDQQHRPDLVGLRRHRDALADAAPEARDARPADAAADRAAASTARHPASTRPACSEQQRHGAEAVGGRGAGDAEELADELQRRGERHRARQPDALGDDRQQRIAGRHGEGADGAGREAVGDQQRIAEAARRTAPPPAPAAARRRACGSAAAGGAGCRGRPPGRPTAGKAAPAPSAPPGRRPRRRHPCAARPRPATGTAPSGCRAARTRCRGPQIDREDGTGGRHGLVLIRRLSELYLVRT